MGRKSKLTPAKYAEQYRLIGSKAGIARALGIDERNLRRWVNRNQKEIDALMEAGNNENPVFSMLRQAMLSEEEQTEVTQEEKINPRDYLVPSESKVDHSTDKTRLKIGIIADTHLCSKQQQLTYLNDFYCRAYDAGVRDIYHAGDMIAGVDVYPGQSNDLIRFTEDEQVDYAVEYYPRIEGLTTHVISGNHDLVFVKRKGGDPLRLISLHRPDINYLGQFSAWVKLANDCSMYLLHPDGGSCFDDQTDILTKEGWKSFSELQKTDFVATMTKGNHEFQWQQPTKITIQDYEGDLINFKARCVDLMVTPNHGMWARENPVYRNRISDSKLVMPQKSHRRISYQWRKIEAQEIYDRYRRQYWQFTNVCESWHGIVENEWIKIPDLPPRKYAHQKPFSPGNIHISDLVELIGWYVTEGSTGKYKVNISQSKTVNPENYKMIIDLLNRLGWHYGCYGEKAIDIHSGAIARFLENKCGKGSRNKKIPAFIKELPAPYLKKLLDVLIRGDGWLQGKNKQAMGYRSISQRLLDDVAEIAIKLGYSVTYNKQKESISINREQVYPTVNTLPDKVPYKGKVFCCSVPNGLILVRRNGRITWTHNSYASSYKLQKLIESFSGGQKPHLAIMGHYHRRCYVSERNVHGFLGACFEAQTDFLRRKAVQPVIGGTILDIEFTDNGSIQDIGVNFRQYLVPKEKDY